MDGCINFNFRIPFVARKTNAHQKWAISCTNKPFNDMFEVGKQQELKVWKTVQKHTHTNTTKACPLQLRHFKRVQTHFIQLMDFLLKMNFLLY